MLPLTHSRYCLSHVKELIKTIKKYIVHQGSQISEHGKLKWGMDKPENVQRLIQFKDVTKSSSDYANLYSLLIEL